MCFGTITCNNTLHLSQEPERIVFHVVTDSWNYPAFFMWFLLNPPGKATVQVINAQEYKWWNVYESSRAKQISHDPRYSSLLNHLRFYLPEIFPQLDKIVFLDHDVVVQRDLSNLWNIAMKGKVNGAVETCQEGDTSFRRMDMFINFSDPLFGGKFDANACTWAFGMNLFDLRQWRRHDLTSSYRRFLSKVSLPPKFHVLYSLFLLCLFCLNNQHSILFPRNLFLNKSLSYSCNFHKLLASFFLGD